MQKSVMSGRDWGKCGSGPVRTTEATRAKDKDRSVKISSKFEPHEAHLVERHAFYDASRRETGTGGTSMFAPVAHIRF